MGKARGPLRCYMVEQNLHAPLSTMTLNNFLSVQVFESLAHLVTVHPIEILSNPLGDPGGNNDKVQQKQGNYRTPLYLIRTRVVPKRKIWNPYGSILRQELTTYAEKSRINTCMDIVYV
jgi:hypothetical protein